jgi:hypothetical protein
VEHVFPESWYPDGTASTWERPKVPSCSECNRAFGKIEERLLRTLGLCLRHGIPGTAGIPDRALRALSPKKGRNERDKFHRERAGRAVMSTVEFIPVDHPTAMPGIKPDLVEKWGQNPSGVYTKGSPALPFPKKDLDAFTRKLVRGLFFLGAEGVALPPEAVIKPFIVGEEAWPHCAQMIEQLQIPPRGVPPGFIFWARAVSRQNWTSLWFFQIWGSFFIQAAAFRRGDVPPDFALLRDDEPTDP